MIPELRRHIEEKFAASSIEAYPFPHLIISNFFPADIYGCIQEFNLFKRNRGREWQAERTSSNVSGRTPYYARKQINFHANDAFEAKDDEARFWGEIAACFLGDHWFESVVLNKYRDYFAIRFGEIVEGQEFFSLFRKELFLQRHEPGYYIGPHTDIPTRVFTCIFSFAECGGFEEYGTQLLGHRDPLVRCWGLDHYPPDDFVLRKLAPYKPNNFLLFFKTRHSFHAVKAIDNSVPNQRYGMQFQLYEPRGGVFRDLSMPGLMQNQNRTGGVASRLKQAAVRLGLR